MGGIELTWDVWHYPTEAVATDTRVLLVLNEAGNEGDGPTLVWFLGTPITD